MEQAIKELYEAWPEDVRRALYDLRETILDVAKNTQGVGEVQEVVRWGQPSFITTSKKTGSTIRIDGLKNRPNAFALYFICHTHLVDQFRERYPESFEFEGNRALVFKTGDLLPKDALRHCIAMALTYNKGSKAAR